MLTQKFKSLTYLNIALLIKMYNNIERFESFKNFKWHTKMTEKILTIDSYQKKFENNKLS